MNLDKQFLEIWHADEERWWNAYGAYMTYQWQLTPTMSKALRKDLERDYQDFLLQPGEHLLDLGCGSGWLSVYFAQHGMAVTGIDVSHEQISAANAMKERLGLGGVSFQCADFINWDHEAYEGFFSSVFVNAFLHHLPPPELEQIIIRIASVLRPGGKLFLYEPLQRSGNRSIAVKFIDRIYNLSLRILLDILPNHFNWASDRHRSELQRGYTMNSPHEAPVAIETLEKICGNKFTILESRGWHLNSLGMGMQSMGLRSSIRDKYEPLVSFAYRIDQLLFRLFGWQAFSVPGRFILCGVKLVRR